MTPEGVLALAHELTARREAFALAIVVRCERPTSARPGAKALVRADGTVSGWIGGSCAEPVVAREALAALADGRPRLVVLVGEGGAPRGRTSGVREYAMTCHSGGTLEIYVEPVLPKPALVLAGEGPVVETLARLAEAVGFAVTVAGDADALGRLLLAPEAAVPAVVVATHGRFDEDALERALLSEAGYVSVVASPRRARAIVDALRLRGVPGERLGRLKAPAGLDLGAETPEEVAVSILAEIIRARRSPAPAVRPPAVPEAAGVREARDPICGMTVAIAGARHVAEVGGRRFYFCCAGCQERFSRDPARYAAGAPA